MAAPRISDRLNITEVSGTNHETGRGWYHVYFNNYYYGRMREAKRTAANDSSENVLDNRNNAA